MNLVDNFKLRAIISEAITSLRFLDTVKPQDDISSELAGFEISKLLKNQEDNELKFAELVKRRANLTQITQKKGTHPKSQNWQRSSWR
jgi:IQ domain-containing protein G